MTTDGKAYVSSLWINKKLQGATATRCDAKAKIFGFLIFLNLCKSKIWSKGCAQFSWLKECAVIKREVQLLLNRWNC